MLNIKYDYLPINPCSRSGQPIDSVKALVVHYLGNPGQSAAGCRAYWEGLSAARPGDSAKSASAHYIVDLDGKVLATVPETEKAFHVGSTIPDPASGKIYTEASRVLFGVYAADPVGHSPNRVTIGIELCHIDDAGQFTPATRQAAVELLAVLCWRYNLDPLVQIMTHQQVVGWKLCPLWFVHHPEDFARFQQEILHQVLQNKSQGGNARQSIP